MLMIYLYFAVDVYVCISHAIYSTILYSTLLYFYLPGLSTYLSFISYLSEALQDQEIWFRFPCLFLSDEISCFGCVGGIGVEGKFVSYKSVC